MNAERMAELADAWGGDLRRWPAAVREDARRFAEAEPEAAERALLSARQLDAALDAVPRPEVSVALRERVIASATRAGLRARAAWPDLRKLLWIGGAGWAAATCAGIVFGLALNTRFEAEAQADAVFEQAMTVGIDDVEVMG